jgi:hypothetical protein
VNRTSSHFSNCKNLHRCQFFLLHVVADCCRHPHIARGDWTELKLWVLFSSVASRDVRRALVVLPYNKETFKFIVRYTAAVNQCGYLTDIYRYILPEIIPKLSAYDIYLFIFSALFVCEMCFYQTCDLYVDWSVVRVFYKHGRRNSSRDSRCLDDYEHYECNVSCYSLLDSHAVYRVNFNNVIS